MNSNIISFTFNFILYICDAMNELSKILWMIKINDVNFISDYSLRLQIKLVHTHTSYIINLISNNICI